MPPFEKSNLYFLRSISLSSASSASDNHDDFENDDNHSNSNNSSSSNNCAKQGVDNSNNNSSSSILETFEKRIDDVGHISPTLQKDITNLVRQAAKVNQTIKKKQGTHKKLARIICESIESIILSTMDQVSNLVDSEDNMKIVLQAIVSASVSRSFESLEKLQDLALGPADDALESRLQSLFGYHREDDTDLHALRPKVLMVASAPSFEVVGGKSSAKQYLPTIESKELPLHVTVTPYVFVTAQQLLERRGGGVISSRYKVEIGSCSHVELFTSSESGTVGEARVQLHVSPIMDNDNSSPVQESKEDDDGEFSKAQDVCRPSVVDVRACQQNVFPRKMQTRLDLYKSSTFGSSALTLTVKMRTLYNSPPAATARDDDDDATKIATMDLQLVLEPLWLHC